MIERRELAVQEGVGDLAREADVHGLPGLLHGGAVREAGRVEDDALAGLDAGPDLDRVAVAGAGGHPAEARLAVASRRRGR